MTQNSSKLKIPWKLLLFRLFVGGIVTLYGPYSILSTHPEPVPLLFSGPVVIGAVLILVGLSVYVRCVWDFAFVGPGDAHLHLRAVQVSQTLVAVPTNCMKGATSTAILSALLNAKRLGTSSPIMREK